MMHKTAIALGLAMVTGVALAAPGGTNHGPRAAGVDTNAAIDTQFNALDADGDGVLSRTEASASKRVSQIYDSLDTHETIEDRNAQSTPAGISRAQFAAGMQALHSGSGSVGPAVSGGQTYILMRDGSRRLKTPADSPGARVPAPNDDAAISAQATRQDAESVGSRRRNEAAVQRERARDDARRMQDRARGGVDQPRSEAEIQRDRARDNAAALQDRARGRAGDDAAQSRSRLDNRSGAPSRVD